jgi:DEAD/DEAH box helicase domain-containing protein
MATPPAEATTIESLLALLRHTPGYRDQIAHVEDLPPRPARYAEPAAPLSQPLRDALAARGVARLYTHQAAALDAARSGAHLGIVTATASGKTLCYQLPALEALLADAANRALLLFPTKALAHDQLRSLDGLLAAFSRPPTTDDQRPTNDQRPTTDDQRQGDKETRRQGDGESETQHSTLNTQHFSATDRQPPTDDPFTRSPAHPLTRSPDPPSSITAATLDGDTPLGRRDSVRAGAQIILSNPDMLHRSLLPDHRRWASWLARLRYVVLDEAHTYRGVFGTHVALIVRRLRRLCAYYGSAPQFICCSATSANPEAHLAALVGAPVTVIADDGAPQGRRIFVFWNPPERAPGAAYRGRGGSQSSDNRYSAPAGRRSTNVETAHLLAALVRANVKTLAFARSRRGAELILRYAREALETINDERETIKPPARTAHAIHPSSFILHPSQIAAYRAGYRPEERRALERAFLDGALLGLVSTNALELGVDIGGVDAVVIGGYPGTVASTWQQAGRAGRAQGSSLAALVAQDDPLDQFYMRHPAQFFARPHEQARVALQNPYILSDQLCCAASELPLHDADATWFGATMPALRDWLLRNDRLRAAGSGAVAAERRPAANVNIRSADGRPVALRDAESGRLIEQIPATRVPFEAHPGAVYLHQGDTYLVQSLDGYEALARRAQLAYYTQPRDTTDIAIERVDQQRTLGPATLCFGVVSVTRQVTGYRRKEHHSEALLSEHDLALPPQTFRTQAVWWTLPEDLSAGLARACGDVSRSAGEGLPGALHALEHAAIGILPLFAQCDRWDIGGVSTALHPDTAAATIFVYDGVPGGVGIAQIGYEQAAEWWAATRDLLRDCPCAEGCPSCVQSPKCGNGNQVLNKEGARLLAEALLGTPLPANGRVAAVTRSPSQDGGSEALLADLRGRLARARAEPSSARRGALLVALRYRLATERAALPADDAGTRAALDAIEAAARDLLGG